MSNPPWLNASAVQAATSANSGRVGVGHEQPEALLEVIHLGPLGVGGDLVPHAPRWHAVNWNGACLLTPAYVISSSSIRSVTLLRTKNP